MPIPDGPGGPTIPLGGEALRPRGTAPWWTRCLARQLSRHGATTACEPRRACEGGRPAAAGAAPIALLAAAPSRDSAREGRSMCATHQVAAALSERSTTLCQSRLNLQWSIAHLRREVRLRRRRARGSPWHPSPQLPDPTFSRRPNALGRPEPASQGSSGRSSRGACRLPSARMKGPFSGMVLRHDPSVGQDGCVERSLTATLAGPT